MCDEDTGGYATEVEDKCVYPAIEDMKKSQESAKDMCTDNIPPECLFELIGHHLPTNWDLYSSGSGNAGC
jgi:hypothetical protein